MGLVEQVLVVGLPMLAAGVAMFVLGAAPDNPWALRGDVAFILCIVGFLCMFFGVLLLMMVLWAWAGDLTLAASGFTHAVGAAGGPEVA